MTFLVFCVFDLKNATREDYLYAYMDLATLGLRQTVKSDNGPSFKLPAAAVMGTFDGRSVDEVRSIVSRKVQGIFKGAWPERHVFPRREHRLGLRRRIDLDLLGAPWTVVD